MRRYLRGIFIITSVALIGALTGCAGQRRENREPTRAEDMKEEKSLLDSVSWQDDSKKIEEFKKLSISAYPDMPVGEIVSSQFSVNKWQYGASEKEEYLLCSYVKEEKEVILIFYKDSYENVNIAEYYVEKNPQSKEEIKKVTEEIFAEKEFSEERTGFFSNGKWAMEITDIDVENKKIEYYSYWWNLEKGQMEQTGTDIKTVDILDADTMGNSDYSIEWNDVDSFNMEKYECEILFNDDDIGNSVEKNGLFWKSGTGKFERAEKPENIPVAEPESEQEASEQESESERIVLAQVPPAGTYWEGDAPPLYAKYYIEISNTKDDRFDFEIYEAQSFNSYGEASDYKLVFKKNTAVFTDAYHAVFEGKQYTLYFECGTNTGYITVSGFDEVIPDGSELYNNAYLQVS